MKLPNVILSRLQRVVADTEVDAKFVSFTELCEAVSKNKWAVTFGFSPKTIADLIIHHKIETEIDQVLAVEEKVLATEVPAPETRAKRSPAINDGVAKLIATYDEGGKGKKQCPSCEKFVGAGNALCACGHQFIAKKGKKFEHVVDDKTVGELLVEGFTELAETPPTERNFRMVNRDGARYRIHTPSGGSPHRLEATDEQTVHTWAERCRKTFLERNGGWLGLPALKYLVREFFDVFPAVIGGDYANTDYAKTCRVLDSLYSSPESI